MKQAIKQTIAAAAIGVSLLLPQSARAASEADVLWGVLGGVILGGIITQPRGVYYPPPPVYYPPPPVYYPPPPVYYPPPCYNKPVPMYDPWGRHIGWREIRVCQ